MKMINTPGCWAVYAPLTIYLVSDGTPYKVLDPNDYVTETPMVPEGFVKLVEGGKQKLIPYGDIRHMTGQKNVLLRVVFRSQERTLRNEEVKGVFERIRQTLSSY